MGTGVVMCVVYGRYQPGGCSCQVNNILQWTLEGVQVVGDKYIRRKSSSYSSEYRLASTC